MGQSFQVLLDSGGLYLALGAVLCTIIGVRAVKRLFQGAPNGRSRQIRNVAHRTKIDVTARGTRRRTQQKSTAESPRTIFGFQLVEFS